MDKLRDFKVKVMEQPSAQEVKQAFADFPRGWYRIIDSPKSMYAMKAEMIDGKVNFAFAEPMIARVYIKNISSFDITIGPEGTLRNDLWFDVQLRGLVQQSIPGAAYDRLSQVLVLKPGQIMTQTVRMDQGQFGAILEKFPNPSLTFFAHVRTNPRGDGAAPGGYDVQFATITERTGFTVDGNTLRWLTNKVSAGTPTERLRALELMAAELQQLNTQPESDQRNLLITTLTEFLKKTNDDQIQPVATWGTFLTAFHSPDKSKEIIDRYKTDPDPLRRLLAVRIATVFLKPDEQKKMIEKMLETEKDESVKLFANGTLDVLRWQTENPTTAPSGGGSRPTTAPASAPTAPTTPAESPAGAPSPAQP
jgi:hypothetical protein